ncbi:MAG: transcriptional regulator [Paenibacillaceae bacterium]|nr:transcriptional regulator [Paenibacillaceae bacterium]
MQTNVNFRLKLKWTILVVSGLILGIAGYYLYSFVHFANQISTKPGGSKLKPITALQTPATDPIDVYTPPKWEGSERVNILLMGGDSRGLKKNEVPRSDSIMIASIDPSTKRGVLFSLLRDTYARIPGKGDDRVNVALALGGPELAMKTISELTGLPLQYYVYTDFKGFIALIDSIGGINFDVEKDMKYSDSEDGHEYDIDLKAGMQHLDGKNALEYVRFRHDALSDFTRTERQRNFLKAVADKLQSSTSLIKLPGILKAVQPYIETNLSLTELLKLGTLGFDMDAGKVTGVQLPPDNLLREQNIRGASVLGVDPALLKKYVLQQLGEGEGVTAEDLRKSTGGRTTGSGTAAGGTGGASAGTGNSSRGGSGAKGEAGRGGQAGTTKEGDAGNEPGAVLGIGGGATIPPATGREPTGGGSSGGGVTGNTYSRQR